MRRSLIEPGNGMPLTRAALAIAACLGAMPSGAQSYLNAGITESIWAVPDYSCTATTGNTTSPVAAIQRQCSHTYTTVAGTSSTITMNAAAQTGLGYIRMQSTANWTNIGPPDFTGGSWGQTSYSESRSSGDVRIEGALYNNTDAPHVYGIASTMRMAGTMYFMDAGTYSQVMLFPWGGQVTSELGINLSGLGGGCNLAAFSYQADLAIPVPPNGFHYDQTCSGGASAIIPAHSYTPLIWTLRAIDSATTNPAHLGGGNAGVDIDFLHTAGISSITASVDGVAVDPSSLDFRSSLNVMLTSTGIAPIPEPASGLLMAAGLGLLLGRSKARGRA